jgi:DNA-binding PadR family transcriptional regulator
MSTQHAQPRWLPPLTNIEYFILLRILNKSLAGIEILEELARETSGKVVLSPGTLYAALKRLLIEGLIEMIEASQSVERPGDSRRKFYRATEKGREQIEDMVAWMRRELIAATEELERPSALPPTQPTGSATETAASKSREQKREKPEAAKIREPIPAQ